MEIHCRILALFFFSPAFSSPQMNEAELITGKVRQKGKTAHSV